jgi:hypothetical protein
VMQRCATSRANASFLAVPESCKQTYWNNDKLSPMLVCGGRGGGGGGWGG